MHMPITLNLNGFGLLDCEKQREHDIRHQGLGHITSIRCTSGLTTTSKMLLLLGILALSSTATKAQPTSSYGQEHCYPPDFLLMVRRTGIHVEEIAQQLNEQKALISTKGKRNLPNYNFPGYRFSVV